MSGNKNEQKMAKKQGSMDTLHGDICSKWHILVYGKWHTNDIGDLSQCALLSTGIIHIILHISPVSIVSELRDSPDSLRLLPY